MEFAIFGAQAIAFGTYQAFNNLYPQKKIRCFLVSQMGNNPSALNGIPVKELVAFGRDLSLEEKNQIEILIATPENVMDNIESELEKYGFHHYARMTSPRWAALMGYHYLCGREFMPLSAFPVGYRRPDIHVYMAKFYKDQPLRENFDMPGWVTPVQAGASLCKERIAEILDCSGENISEKNGNYSELTVLYWVWKNRLRKKCLDGNDRVCYFYPQSKGEKGKAEYYGLFHYRRILELSEDDLLRLEINDIDAVLPYPMPYEPDIEEHHKRYLADADWQALLTALQELQPEYAHAFPAILHQKYLYNYNIILAEKKVLADYCGWLFPILKRVEQLSEPKGWERKDRYIGYMGETLETLYFMHNRDKLNIVHTGCRFLV